MQMLIAVSSKHGSTREIAGSIAETVRDAGIEVDVVDAEQVESVASYDAVIVGSALHMGHWMGPARALVNRTADALRTRPVWLFSSGPLGRGTVDPADAAEGLKLLELVGAREHRVFAGKADKHELGFGERAILRMVKDPYGDHRDWIEIREWATSIARELTTVPVGTR
ncbi:MAG: flavodoxin domain-containing protein [Candidatus Limnocylindrales bacterium]